MPLDKRDGLASEGVRRLVEFLHLFIAAQDAGGVHVAMRTVEEAVELVKATLGRTHFRRSPQVPLADQARYVIRHLETISKGGFRERQALAAGG